eukprot:10770653-Heterocapsa_arctica.AAC.1
MVGILNWVVRQTQKDKHMRDLVDFAYEWARWSSGWALEAINDLRRALRCTGEFDGCMYGLQDAKGLALRKPWRV